MARRRERTDAQFATLAAHDEALVIIGGIRLWLSPRHDPADSCS